MILVMSYMDTSDLTNLKLSFYIQQLIQTIEPLLCVSSKLDRALGELYELLVRQILNIANETCKTIQSSLFY